MARGRTPTNVLKLRGSDKVHPERMRDRAAEPAAVGEIGKPPRGLSLDERRAWKELSTSAHAGTLCAADRPFLLYACGVWAEVRRQVVAGKGVNPQLGVRFESIISRLGMSPADRSRVLVIKTAPGADPFAEFVDAG